MSATKRQVGFERWGRIDGSCSGVAEWCEKPNFITVAGQLEVPRGLPSMPTFQGHVVSCLCVLHWDYSLFSQALRVPYTICSVVWRGRVDSLNMVQWELR